MNAFADEGAFLAEKVPPELFDLLLSQGWRHFGELFYFYQKVEDGTEAETRHVRPLRVRLEHFRRSKSQRRTWNRNADLSIELKPLARSPELDALFDCHKRRFCKDQPESLGSFLGEDPGVKPTDTRQFELRLDGKLLACSFLDVGRNSVSSIYAMFHPEEHRRRLGIFTMLLEIDWALQNGRTFYYPGYAYREPSHYDYKKEFRGTEYFDWKTWQPLELGKTLG
ncbi:MAG: arginine-tRNA-protein transferase [Akkermansiaceae bacterium]